MRRRAAALLAALVGVSVIVPTLGGVPTTAAPLAAGRVHKHFHPNDGKIFVLVIGNDARFGNHDRALADGIHLVGINARTMKGGILNFPRDSWVNIPNYGTAKINEALWAGGPVALARTLERLTGIHIDYWVMVGFEGFQEIISRLGGLRMTVPFDLYDPGGSGANLRGGRQRLRSWEVLAFARTRHNFRRGDIDRTTNQGKILLALLKKFRSEVAANPAAVLKWATVTRSQARLDMSLRDMFRLGILASQVSARDVGNVTVPASAGWVGQASVVHISPAAQSIYRRFKKNASL